MKDFFVLMTLSSFLGFGAYSHADTGVYAGAGIGTSTVEDSAEGLSFDDSTTAWKIFGGYQFHPNFAAEVAYLDFGEASDTVEDVRVEADIDGFSVSVVGVTPAQSNLQVFGKVGYFDGEADVSALGLSVDDDDSGLALGAGVKANISDAFNIRIEFDYYDSDLDDLWTLGVGAELRF